MREVPVDLPAIIEIEHLWPLLSEQQKKVVTVLIYEFYQKQRSDEQPRESY